MNPIYSSAEALNSALPLHEVQYPDDISETSNEAQYPDDISECSNESYSYLSNSLTPLGEEMTVCSAKLRAEDPLKWLREYWLNIIAVGTVWGYDVTLLALGMEHARLEDEIDDEFNMTWCQYEDSNSEAYVEKWERMTLDSEEAKRYLRDIDRMMVYGHFKNSEYLQAAEQKMIDVLRAGKVKVAQRYFNGLGLIYQKLEAWRVAKKEEANDSDTSQVSLYDSEIDQECYFYEALVDWNEMTNHTPPLKTEEPSDEWDRG